jgi:hypothetical protein
MKKDSFAVRIRICRRSLRTAASSRVSGSNSADGTAVGKSASGRSTITAIRPSSCASRNTVLITRQQDGLDHLIEACAGKLDSENAEARITKHPR